MRKMIVIAALLPLLAQAEGRLTVQPQGNNSVRIFSQGETGSGGSDTLGIVQAANRATTLSVSPSGVSQCAGGDIVLEGLRVSVTNMLDNSKLECGASLFVGADSQKREIPLKVSATLTPRKTSRSLTATMPGNLPIGSVSVMEDGGESQQYPLYLDLSLLQDQMEVLTASFSKPALHLGSVGDNHDVSGTVTLRVSKTLEAGNEAMPWTLSLESSQAHNNQYRMRASTQDRMVPYHILISDHEILPNGVWQGRVPAGSGTSQAVDIQFKLEGKQTRGMAAGISLMDTVTAVITPES
ncbi:hypothetical protein [Metakosakonia massiliensis]|uniref:Uncharacterized protein n=1 Tax=Phytobacter massiliensis TaxID=1485952 RepID=A0A6N3EWK3_9ENTR|nr:hypothetical protein [Phytobacter massiliensis]